MVLGRPLNVVLKVSSRGMAVQQRELPVAPGSSVHGAWHEAVIALSGCEAASMTGVERTAVIQRGRPGCPDNSRSKVSYPKG